MTGLLGQAVGLQIIGDIQPVQHHRDHGPGQQVRQRIFHGTVLVQVQVPQNPGIQLSLVQSRLQVQHKAAALSFEMAAGAEHRWAGHAEMGKQQLAKILI